MGRRRVVADSARAPRRVAAHAVDAELLREFQVFNELIAIHGEVRLKPDATYAANGYSCGVRLQRDYRKEDATYVCASTRAHVSCGVRLQPDFQRGASPRDPESPPRRAPWSAAEASRPPRRRRSSRRWFRRRTRRPTARRRWPQSGLRASSRVSRWPW